MKAVCLYCDEVIILRKYTENTRIWIHVHSGAANCSIALPQATPRRDH